MSVQSTLGQFGQAGQTAHRSGRLALSARVFLERVNGTGGAVPPCVGNGALPTCRWAGACQGGLAAPLAIPGIPGWLALRVPPSLATGLRFVIDAVSPSWLHIRSGYPCPRAKTGAGLLIPLHLRFGPDVAITGSTSCLATAPCARSSASQTGPTSKPKAKSMAQSLVGWR